MKNQPLVLDSHQISKIHKKKMQTEKKCDIEKFLTTIRKSRDIEDRIVYRLNDAVRTKTMSQKFEGGCDSLKQELVTGREQRVTQIRDCLGSHEVAMSAYKESLHNGEVGFSRVKFQGMRVDRNLLVSDQQTEFNTRARVDKLFAEKCGN